MSDIITNTTSTNESKVFNVYVSKSTTAGTALVTRGSLNKTDTAPTVAGLYILEETGVYANLGNIDAQSGKINFASFDGTTWSLIAVDVNTNNALDFINFSDNNGGYINDNYDSIETIRTPTSYTITNNAYSLTSNYNSSNNFNSKVLVFDSQAIYFNNITGSDSRNIQWIILGKNNSGNYLAISLTNGSTSIGLLHLQVKVLIQI